MVRNFQAARDQSRLLMLPLTHSEFLPSAPTSPPELDSARLAWFDHWLHGLPDAPLPGARVTSRELPGREGRWVEFDDLPDQPRAERLGWHFRGTLGGTSATGWTSTFRVDPFDNSCACFDRGLGPPTPDAPVNDQRVPDEHRLHFDGPPLEEDRVIVGAPVAHLRAALSAPDGNLVVHLNSVAPDGTETVITSGWLRASHVRSHRFRTPLRPDFLYDFTVELWPTHWRVPAGHRLRVSVSGGDAATIQPDPAGARSVTVALGSGGSWIDIPYPPG
jgi:putative CocE/NonD family hydrolase